MIARRRTARPTLLVRLACPLCLSAVLASAALAAAPDVSERLAALPRDRLIAFGDVHGGAAELLALLSALQVVDADGSWAGGRTRLVSLGDLLDRGPDSRQVMDLLMRLESEASAAGGSLQLVLGNHELMNLTGDMRYVSADEYAAFAAEEDLNVREREKAKYVERARALIEAQTAAPDAAAESAPAPPENPAETFERLHPPGFFAHRAAFSPSGRYGRWLLGKPQILVLDRTAFVHGGLSEAFVTLGIAEHNRQARAELDELLALGARLVSEAQLTPWQDLLTAEPLGPTTELPPALQQLREALQFSGAGPAWYRGTAACHGLIERPLFEAVLAARDLERIVMGHTPTFPRIIQTRFEDRAILADTGMFAGYYRGRPSAVVFGGDAPLFLTLESDGRLAQRSGHPAVDLRAGDESALLEELRKALADRTDQPPEPLEIVAGNRRHLAWHRAGRKKEREQRLAAWRLDKHLGLGLTAPVLTAGPEGKHLWEVMPADTLTEGERASTGRFRPNWCAEGSDYDLMYALDALLGMDVRRAETLHYDPATWALYLTGQEAAFPTWERLPRYLAERPVTLPPLLIDRLANLSANALEAELGDYLNRRQIRAVLARRDVILERWVNPADDG